MRRNSVDFPAPLGPSKPRISPCRRSRSTPWSTVRAPYPTTRSRTSNNGPMPSPSPPDRRRFDQVMNGTARYTDQGELPAPATGRTRAGGGEPAVADAGTETVDDIFGSPEAAGDGEADGDGEGVRRCSVLAESVVARWPSSESVAPPRAKP